MCVGKDPRTGQVEYSWVLWKTLSSILGGKNGNARSRQVPIELGIVDFTDEGKRYAQESDEEQLEEFRAYQQRTQDLVP